jgi:hypothetical protein
MRYLGFLTNDAPGELQGGRVWRARGFTLTTTAALVGAMFLYAPSATSSTTVNASANQVQVATSGVVPSAGTVNGLAPAARRAPTAGELAYARAESARRPLAGPARATAKVTQPAAGISSPAVPPPGSRAAAAPVLFRNTVVATSGVTSVISEPSTDQLAADIFQTSNWTAQFSHNNGTSWTSLNPFAIFGSGFCCDQVTVRDTRRARQLWLLQYGDHLTLASTPTSNLATWCTYTLTPQGILGRPAGEAFDYNDLAIGNGFLYLTSNLFSASGFTGTALIRFNLDNLSACQAAGFSRIVRADLFTLKVAQGTTGVAFAASTNLNTGTGSTLRILTWPENSNLITTTNKAIAAFSYMSNNSGQSCASADGLVNNWCQRTDSRILGAARGDGKVRFSFNVKQTGTARPFPYTRMATFRESDLALLTNQDLFGTTVAHLYASMAPDARGQIGYVDSFGGGTGATHFFPGAMIGIVDSQAPDFPGSTNFFLFGVGGGCLNAADGLRRWGDYNTARGGGTAAGTWTASSWARTSSADVGCGTATPISLRNVLFGR